MIFENIKVLIESTRPSVLIRHPEWILDAILSGAISPSDTIVVTGFWRSGTTWLLEVLAKAVSAKSIFEPLKPDITGYRKFAIRYYPGPRDTIDGFMPYVAGDLTTVPALRRHLVRALTGAAPGIFVRAARLNVREEENRSSPWFLLHMKERLVDALPRRVVTKFTRAHLILPLLQSEFSPLVLHIRRDPRAVVESLRRQEWAHWMRTMSLENYLLEPADGRSAVFSHWTEEIRMCDREGYLSRTAGYWALVEWYVTEFGGKERIDVSFETLCRGREDYLTALSERIGIDISEQLLHGESRTSDETKTVNERIHGWRRRLSEAEANKIEEVVHRFDMEELLEGSPDA